MLGIWALGAKAEGRMKNAEWPGKATRGEGRRRKEAEDEREHRTSNIQHPTSTAAKPTPSESRK
jgi:hypothetical protein